MKKGIIGGALLFASACGTPDAGGAAAADASPDGQSDSVGLDAGAADAGAADAGAADAGAADAALADTDIKDTTAFDGSVADAGPLTVDAESKDVPQPPQDVATDASCDKPSSADAPQMIGTPCAEAFQAVCDGKGQVVIMCQGGQWQTWSGGGCGCTHTQCGPDQASCIAVGFVGVSRAGRTRKVGRVVRLFA